MDEELYNILQSSLSIIEIDKEISRLKEKQDTLKKQLEWLDIELMEQEVELAEKREKAGKVLRAYFMGERNDIILALFNSQSLESFLKKLEFIEFILQYDKRILDSYIQEYNSLNEQYEVYWQEEQALQEATYKLEVQRERIITLEKQVDDQLKGRSDTEKVLLLIKELTAAWEENGVVQVEQYLHYLADAMQALPSWLQKNDKYLSMKALKYTISLPDTALNAFLVEHNNAFSDFSFTFKQDKIIAYGKKDDLEVELHGHYAIVDEPSHMIAFTIDSLFFNGFKLPATTIEDLEAKYNMNFYPSLIFSLLRANYVEIEDGMLTIELQLKL